MRGRGSDRYVERGKHGESIQHPITMKCSPCAELSKHCRDSKRRDLPGILHTFCPSHTVLSASSLPHSPFALYSPFLLFYICLWQNLCSVYSAEVCGAKRQNDKEESESADAAYRWVTIKEFGPKRATLFSPLITIELVSREARCPWYFKWA